MKMSKRARLGLALVAIVILIAIPLVLMPKSRGGNTVTIRQVAASAVLGGNAGVELELYSEHPFLVVNSLVFLQIGRDKFYLSGYKDGGLNTLVFTLTPEEFAHTKRGDPIIVRYDPDSQGQWDFGFLDK